jgi:hypothetical protein
MEVRIGRRISAAVVLSQVGTGSNTMISTVEISRGRIQCEVCRDSGFRIKPKSNGHGDWAMLCECTRKHPDQFQRVRRAGKVLIPARRRRFKSRLARGVAAGHEGSEPTSVHSRVRDPSVLALREDFAIRILQSKINSLLAASQLDL